MMQLKIYNSESKVMTYWNNFLNYVLSNMTTVSAVDDYLAEFDAKLILCDGRTMLQFEDDQYMSIFLLKFS